MKIHAPHPLPPQGRQGSLQVVRPHRERSRHPGLMKHIEQIVVGQIAGQAAPSLQHVVPTLPLFGAEMRESVI